MFFLAEFAFWVFFSVFLGDLGEFVIRTDVSQSPQYQKLIGKKDLISGRDCFVYSTFNKELLIDSIGIHVPGIEKHANLKEGSEVTIVGVCRIERHYSDAITVEEVPIVSFIDPVKMTPTFARASFLLLQHSSGFYRKKQTILK